MTPLIYSMTGLELATFGLTCMAAGSVAMLIAVMLAASVRSSRERNDR